MIPREEKIKLNKNENYWSSSGRLSAEKLSRNKTELNRWTTTEMMMMIIIIIITR